jgi:hypothetical protein
MPLRRVGIKRGKRGVGAHLIYEYELSLAPSDLFSGVVK